MNVKHGLTHHPLYVLWQSMMRRCYEPTYPEWTNYGGRGITVCTRWHNVVNFVEDMGQRKPKTTLDRIDNNGNYEPSNCRWATIQQQNRNKRNNKLTIEQVQAIRLVGRKLSTREIGRVFGVNSSTVSGILTGKYWSNCEPGSAP